MSLNREKIIKEKSSYFFISLALLVGLAGYILSTRSVLAQGAAAQNELPQTKQAAKISYSSTTAKRGKVKPAPVDNSLDVAPAERALALNEEGVKLVLEGNKDEGLKKLKEAHLTEPRNTTVLYNLAGLYLANDNPKEAIKLMEQAVLFQPEDPSFLNRLAESYYAEKNFKQAINYYEKLSVVDPNFEDIWLRLGVLYGADENWEKSESALRKAAEHNQNEPKIWSSLGSVLIGRKKYKEAVEVITRAEELKKIPENAVALGMAHEGQGDYATAIGFYEQARELGSADKELSSHIDELKKLVGK